ncbi:hypothetical protein DPMN_166251 [Dreissena polymorpha]|uniref:Uncharacterized protein n=1 Tax=Dreissena polymorpha TaxID=45954 RepID=A0A9D4IVB7_DREPO|nr:hypothetical protein DPMN_166251 [Dreissena polymorpha]
MYSALVGAENYYLGYDVMVGVFNDLGAGPNSSVVTVFSAMGSKRTNMNAVLAFITYYIFYPFKIHGGAFKFRFARVFIGYMQMKA